MLRKSAKSFRVQFLGKGDYVTIAQAYRQVAKEKGWLVTWDEKLKTNPERAKLFGAANFKLWSTLDRRMNEESTQEESVRVNWTFDEAAQVAEHLKRDLKLDRVLFIIGGWIHRGYDNQHPDILPDGARVRRRRGVRGLRPAGAQPRLPVLPARQLPGHLPRFPFLGREADHEDAGRQAGSGRSLGRRHGLPDLLPNGARPGQAPAEPAGRQRSSPAPTPISLTPPTPPVSRNASTRRIRSLAATI